MTVYAIITFEMIYILVQDEEGRPQTEKRLKSNQQSGFYSK